MLRPGASSYPGARTGPVTKGPLVHRLPSRLAAVAAVVVGAVLCAGATTAAAATPTATTDPARAGAGYLARQLAVAPGGLLQSGGYPRQGETIDALLSLAAAKVAAGQQAATLRVLTGQEASYVSYPQQDGSVVYYPGSLGKLALAVQAEGADPDTVGPVRLLTQLRSMQCIAADPMTAPKCTAAEVGLYKSYDSDVADGSDDAYNSTVNQSLAMIALSGTPTPPSRTAVSWLVGQQCRDGGYQTAIRTDPATACTAEDADSTSLATQALAANGSPTAAGNAAGYLAAHQASAGSLTGASGAASANSTALAAQAFTAVGGPYAADAARARDYLVSVQAGCAAPAATRGSVSAPADGDATFATSQAVQGIVGTPLARISATGSTAAVPTLACTAVRSPAPSRPAAASAGPSVTPVAVATPVTTTLPATGGPQVPRTALAGLGLLVVGGALLVAGRPRRHSA